LDRLVAKLEVGGWRQNKSTYGGYPMRGLFSLTRAHTSSSVFGDVHSTELEKLHFSFVEDDTKPVEGFETYMAAALRKKGVP
jgi:hypothetical protein